jgi:hypothetical protein
MSKPAIIGLAVALLGIPVSASAGQVRHTYSCYSEMVSCGKQGVKGNRAQFVAAITQPVEKHPFLWQLAH